MWRGAVESAIRGKRGQAFLKEMLSALDAMPEKRLIANSLEQPQDGAVCALGAVGRARGLDMKPFVRDDDDDYDAGPDGDDMASLFGIAAAMACEIMHVNDEDGRHKETPEQRFNRVRRWVERKIRLPKANVPVSTE